MQAFHRNNNLSHYSKRDITKLDVANGTVDDWTGVNGLVGFSSFYFSFFNGGGTGNLSPGRPTSKTFNFMSPPNSGGPLVCVSLVNGAFVNSGGGTLTQRPLGQFSWNVWVPASGVLECQIVLSDENGDDPIVVQVGGTLLFFGL
jgi:hypothetical protein